MLDRLLNYTLAVSVPLVVMLRDPIAVTRDNYLRTVRRRHANKSLGERRSSDFGLTCGWSRSLLGQEGPSGFSASGVRHQYTVTPWCQKHQKTTGL